MFEKIGFHLCLHFAFFIRKAFKISMTGVKYHLKKPNFKATGYSISNVIEENHFSIEIKNGFLLFILYDRGIINTMREY